MFPESLKTELNLASRTQGYYMDSHRIQIFCLEPVSNKVNRSVTKPHRATCTVKFEVCETTNVNHFSLSLHSTHSVRGIDETFEEYFKVYFAAVSVAEDCIFQHVVLL